MQKIINMNLQPLVWGLLKPTLKKKFGFVEINKAVIIANRLEDTLQIIGKGYAKNDLNEKTVETNKLKLSENSDYVQLFDNKVKEEIKDFKTINVSYTNIDFISKSIETDVFFTKMDDTKSSAKIKIDKL